MSELNSSTLWNRCLEIVRDNVPEQTYTTWFVPIKPLSYDGKTLVVQVPSQFFYEYIEEKFVDLLKKSLYKVCGEGTRLLYNVMVNRSARPAQTVTLESTPRPLLGRQTAPPTTESREIPTSSCPEIDTHLREEYNFETFIEGASNKLSRSVAEAVARDPAKTVFNPFFLYGASGVGKTHLANAIGLKVKELHPQMRVLYVSAHLFQVQYTDSVRNNTVNDFINFYQTIDVLIVDDIQEFAGVTKTQNTFFHIFNHLHQNGRQLILTSDRPPVLLQGMEERLVTRFKWGMVAELERPTVELRKAILQSKIDRDGLQFPPEVVDYIAENVGDSVRALEGIVISILAHSTIYNREIDLDLARSIVGHVVEKGRKLVTVEQIVGIVCQHYQIEAATIQTRSRKREVVQARQVAMYLAKKYTNLSTSKIGSMIGNRDHATVMHACKAVKELVEVDKAFSAGVAKIQAAME